MAKANLVFTQIDIDTLDEAQQTAFMAYLQAKSDFRAALQTSAPQGKRIVFTEKYGTVDNPGQSVLKIAMTAAGSAKPKAAVKSLSDFLETQDANGFAR